MKDGFVSGMLGEILRGRWERMVFCSRWARKETRHQSIDMHQSCTPFFADCLYVCAKLISLLPKTKKKLIIQYHIFSATLLIPIRSRTEKWISICR